MQNSERVIGVLGATSLVGQRLLTPNLYPNEVCNEKFVAFTRKETADSEAETSSVRWYQLSETVKTEIEGPIDECVCLAPIWVLPDYFELLVQLGVRRIVVLSSTSRFTKTNSCDAGEQETARLLIEGERLLQNWAEAEGITWIILRPTLIYGFGRDKNIATVARLIRRLKFFPLPGKAKGLRQPIHADDVAIACLQALRERTVGNHAYNISGAETLSYDELIKRVFSALGMKPRCPRIPLSLLRVAATCLKVLPRYRNISMGMAERMNSDLTFSHTEASADFGFEPRTFLLHQNDVHA